MSERTEPLFTVAELLRCWAQARRNAVNPDLAGWRHIYERQMADYAAMVWRLLI